MILYMGKMIYTKEEVLEAIANHDTLKEAAKALKVSKEVLWRLRIKYKIPPVRKVKINGYTSMYEAVETSYV